VADGKYTEEEAPCIGRDDCLLTRVGDPVIVMPVAFPIRPDDPDTMTAMSWAVTDASNAGKWDAAVRNNADLIPPSRCVQTAVSSDSIDWDGFGGTSFFLAVTVVLALGIRFGMVAASTVGQKKKTAGQQKEKKVKFGVDDEVETVKADSDGSLPSAQNVPPRAVPPSRPSPREDDDGNLKAILKDLDEMQGPTIWKRLDELQASIESIPAMQGSSSQPGRSPESKADVVFVTGAKTNDWLPFLSGLNGTPRR
jgi:hypothetical protein